MSPQQRPSADNNHSYTAESDSTVGVQGIVHGDVHMYEVGPDDPPERKLTVAKRFLDVMIPRRAEDILEGLAGLPYETNQVAYYWMLAILSGRTLGRLDPHDRDNLQKAWKLATQGTRDRWSWAAEVVKDLCGCLASVHWEDGTQTSELSRALEARQRLPEQQQDEIRRHLDALVTGGFRQQFELDHAEQIRRRRLNNGREDRVPKFFEPVPHPPLDSTPPAPTLTSLHGITSAIALSLGAVGSFLSLRLILGHSPVLGLAITALALTGATVMVRQAPARFPDRFFPWPAPTRQARRRMDRAVNRVFEQVRRSNSKKGESTKGWSAATRRLRADLSREYACIYSDADFPANRIEYLLKPRAQEAWRQWRSGDLPRNHNPAAGKFGWGATAFTVAALITLAATIVADPRHAVAPLALMMVAALLLPAGGGDIFLVRLFHRPTEKKAAADRQRTEDDLYRKRTEELRDRPDDPEMAHWLDDDRNFTRSLVMKKCDVKGEDVIADALLTVPAPGCRKARVPNGPWRYTKYNIWVYLLTGAGVRLVKVTLDFATGKLSNQERTAFRYDAIASASIIERGICLDDQGGQEPISPPDQPRYEKKKTPKADEQDQRDQERRHRNGNTPDDDLDADATLALEVTLISGHSFVAEVDALLSVTNGNRQGEDPALLRQIVLDDTGLGSALQVLELAAAEGGEWVEQTQKRAEPIFVD
ncbi:hypothetical protein ACQP1W_00730 [Spirillospora sp. CA-255316]